MTFGTSKPPPVVSSSDGSRRDLSTGSICYVMLSKDDTVVAGDDFEIFLRNAGRGRARWSGTNGRDRSGAAILLPPGATLSISGHLRALRVVLPGLVVTEYVGPLAEALIGLLCSRAWRSSDEIAETSLALVRLLIHEEMASRAEHGGAHPRLN
ncbi:hypothetical protein [Litoreibacter roseus]|uniref:Uncharacterized protein n=1 Tax=Litoreibacter roseus TaxID=2601869 RepID=A0A6N6JKD6_9RHOB|nr:hypothetical protein [Litoreibacter roseus]GFE66604.1 hypothetical protein KIN_36780 [Litoreibacter roseus]